jgi:predicted nuclease with TOPRIM domain
VSATVRPTPADLESKISDAPEWEVENILSIQSAENFYNNLRKELEAVVFNENIVLGKDSLKKYDGIRAKIDEQLDKIKEAQKEKKKLEEKETDLEDKFEGGEDEMASDDLGDLPPIPGEENLEGEAPTEEIVTEEGQESPFGKRNPK